MISGDINTPIEFNWKIALALVVAWVLVYMCMIKGIASSGKVNSYELTWICVICSVPEAMCQIFRIISYLPL